MPLSDLEITTDRERIDVELVHRFLTTSYWATGRPREVVQRSIDHSLCFSAFIAGQQVAFGRAITDYAVFAYIADVFVVPAFQGQGIGKALVRAMVDHPQLKELQLVLRTRDAHGLYAQFGFNTIPGPENTMARYPASHLDHT